MWVAPSAGIPGGYRIGRSGPPQAR